MTEALDTDRSSAITDHPYTPPIDPVTWETIEWGLCAYRPMQPNPLNRDKPMCRMAEAAHKETTVKR